MRKKPVIVGTVLAAVGLAAVGWFVHKPLLAKYYVGQLAKTPEADADARVARVARLGEAAVPRLLELLKATARAVPTRAKHWQRLSRPGPKALRTQEIWPNA